MSHGRVACNPGEHISQSILSVFSFFLSFQSHISLSFPLLLFPLFHGCLCSRQRLLSNCSALVTWASVYIALTESLSSFIIVTIHIVIISSTYENHNYCLCHTNVHEQNMFIIINSLFAWAKANAPIERWYPRKKNKCTDIHFNSFFTVDFESLPLQQQTKNRIGRALF